MNYGKFSEDGREYIIENVETPSPWINYIYNDKYFSTISNNGGGISYYKNPLHGRITRYRINDIPSDRPGKYIYVRDNDSEKIWSLTWQPVGADKTGYKVIHGFGYTKALSFINDIRSEVLYFVPRTDDLEIWHVKMKNESDQPKNFSVFGYVEFALGHALVDLINQCDDQHFNRLNFDNELNSLFATKTYWVTETRGTQQQENKAWDRVAFFTASEKITAYETMREKFIGNYRNENNPVAVENNKLTSADTDYGNSVGAVKFEIKLAPGEEKEFTIVLGVIEKENFETLKEQTVKKYMDVQKVQDAFLQVQEYWNNYINRNIIKTPDANTNIFMNNWIKYQAKVAHDVGRVASYYYWGISRGFGFRDLSQDTLTTIVSDIRQAKERLLLLSRQIFPDGRAYHHFYADGQGELTKHSDDPLWFLLVLTDYIKETGEFGILDEVQKFADGSEGTILEHAFAVVNFAKNNQGKHGLPIFGRGDWNDTLDYIGGADGGESIWAAMFYVTMLNRFILLLKKTGNNVKATEVETLKNNLAENIEKHCWDGDWYIRAFGAADVKIGSNQNTEGKIFLNPQCWSVLAELPDKQRLIKAMDSVASELDTRYGPKKCAPAYREINPNIGLITRCVAGKKENAAIFCHPTTWVIQAETMLGRGNKAYEYFTKMLPNNVDSDIFVAEPYVYSQYITSNEHTTSEGRASHSWQTGTAVWMFRVSLDYILGIRSDYDGLLIDPVIPSHWDKFYAERVFRNCRYKITVTNPELVESGVKQILADGKLIEGNQLPLSQNEVCEVEVILGKKQN